jgi:hypothetical protein
VRRDHADGRIADRGREHRGGPVGRPASLADGEQRADQRADHVVAERVGYHGGDRDAVIVPLPGQGAQRPYGGRALPPTAEGGEIVLAQARAPGLVHGGQVEPPEVPQRLVPAQRVGGGLVVTDAVGVAAPQRGEPRVESAGREARGPHPDIGGQQAGQAGDHPARSVIVAGPGLGGDVQVDDLAAGVHPGIGAAGHRQSRGGRQPQHSSERCGQHVLYGPPAGLGGPPGKG